MIPLTRLVNGVALPLYVLRQIADKVVINPRAISNTTSLPNPGPGLEYLPILTDEPPDNDPTFTVRTQTEGPNEISVPPQWEIHFQVKDRPEAEKLAAADNAKRFEVQKQVPPQDFTEMVVLTLAAVLRDAKGLELTPHEQERKDQLIAVAAKLSQNAANLDDIKKAINDGNKPDLSAGWVPLE